MGLKGDRILLDSDITMTAETTPIGRGVIMVHKTSGSGIGLGDTAGQCEVVLNPSGKVPVGLLINDVVNIDTTRYYLNRHKDEVNLGERVHLARKGRFTVNGVGGTPAVGGTAYLTTSGTLTATVSATGGTAATPIVGEWRTIKDENGWATVDINLPRV